MSNKITRRRQDTLRRRFNQLSELEKDYTSYICEEYMDLNSKEEDDFGNMVERITASDLSDAVKMSAVMVLEKYRNKHIKLD